jgi:hypothetical protein
VSGRRAAHRAVVTHLVLAVTWALLMIPTLIWWKTSILWVALMSGYANVASHWGAYQASRSERRMADD